MNEQAVNLDLLLMETHLNMNFEKRNKNYFKFYVSPKPFLKFGICLLQIK